jgi:hypothetical protein
MLRGHDVTVRLPALHGDDALGFLAALGLASLSEQGEIPALRLAWSGRAAPVALVEGEVSSVEELGEALSHAFARLLSSSAVIPGVPANFPRAKAGSGKDPMRMTRAEMADLYRDFHNAWCAERDRWPARWLISIAAQSSIQDAKRGDVRLTPFYAPTGQMALRTSIFGKTMDAVTRVQGPSDALTHWRRATGIDYDGANYDERAKRDAAVTTSGKPANQGAPSPTWLAAMAIRLFPVIDQGDRTKAVAWQPVRLYPGYTSRSLVWPVWEPALDPPGVRAMISLPDLQLEEQNGRWAPKGRAALTSYGVRGVFGASRRTLSQGDGPLGPTVRLWVARG